MSEKFVVGQTAPATEKPAGASSKKRRVTAREFFDLTGCAFRFDFKTADGNMRRLTIEVPLAGTSNESVVQLHDTVSRDDYDQVRRWAREVCRMVERLGHGYVKCTPSSTVPGLIRVEHLIR